MAEDDRYERYGRHAPKDRLDDLRLSVAIAHGSPVARASMNNLVDIVLEDGLPSKAERARILEAKHAEDVDSGNS